MGGVGMLDHCIGDAAAAVALAGRPFLQARHPGADLGLRIAGVGRDHPLESVEEVAAVVAQIGGGQLVLGGEGAVEAGLGHASLADDLVDSYRADALAVEQVPRRLADTIGGPLGRRSHLGHACLLTM